jgi:hypothetical protein
MHPGGRARHPAAALVNFTRFTITPLSEVDKTQILVETPLIRIVANALLGKTNGLLLVNVA